MWKDLIDTINEIREWINSHHKTVIITIFIFLILFSHPQGGSGNTGFIILILFFGLPTVLGFCRGICSIFGKKFLSFPTSIKIRILILTAPLLILSLGIVAFLMAFLGEFSIQLTCSGAGCAQGGVGLFMVLPFA